MKISPLTLLVLAILGSGSSALAALCDAGQLRYVPTVGVISMELDW